MSKFLEECLCVHYAHTHIHCPYPQYAWITNECDNGGKFRRPCVNASIHLQPDSLARLSMSALLPWSIWIIVSSRWLIQFCIKPVWFHRRLFVRDINRVPGQFDTTPKLSIGFAKLNDHSASFCPGSRQQQLFAYRCCKWGNTIQLRLLFTKD